MTSFHKRDSDTLDFSSSASMITSILVTDLSSCTLSNVQIQDLHAMPQPKAPTNGYHNPLLQGSWKDKLPTPKPTQMPPPQQPKINHAMANLNIGFDHSNRLDFGSSRSMENTKPGDTSVCIICTQRRRGKRMKELYKDCIHDRFGITYKLEITQSLALSAIAARTCMNK